MAKKVRQSKMETSVDLPADVYDFLKKISKSTQLSIEDCMSVLIVSSLIRESRPKNKSRTK